MNRDELRWIEEVDRQFLQALEAHDYEGLKKWGAEIAKITKKYGWDAEGYVMTLFAYGYTAEQVEEILGGE